MITTTDIEQWADRIEARSLLPVLIRRLVRETTPELTSIRFPGHETVALHGVDGETSANAPTLWVPRGTTHWEMGCNKTPAAKATEDYDKRVEKIDQDTRQSDSFVFVTPRRWPGKNEWLSERRDWAEVRALDVVDLDTWLDEAPTTRLWLAELLDKTHPGLATPETWFRGWSSASMPNITPRLVADRSGGVGEALVKGLRDGDRTIPIVADSRQEAVAFCIATLEEAEAHDLLDRMVVVSSPDVVPGAGQGPRPILLLDLPTGVNLPSIDRDRFQVIRPMAKGETADREKLELPHVGADQFREALEEMGFNRDEAQRRALEVGHSVTVLRRRLSDDPAVRQPAWAQDATTARRLLPHALVGGWVEREHFDDVAFLSLLAEITEEDVARGGRALTKGEDAPLVQIGNVMVTVSQLDALFAVGPYVETGDLDRFFTLVSDAFRERDPKLDLPEDDWWCANIYGKSRSYSGALLSGMGDTLGVLAVHGNSICGSRLSVDLRSRIDRLVRELMSDMASDAWISIRPHLRALAEAAPVAFLDCVEADLDREDQPIASIMRCIGEVGISQTCLRTELLWALEALAWSPKYFARVAEIVFRLCAFEANGNYSNNPASTAAAMFRDWVPSTVLSVEQRMDILARLAPRYRSAAIEVCRSLLATCPRFATQSAMPRWLAVEGDYDTVTNVDCWNAQRVASRVLLDLGPLTDEELHAVLDTYGRLHPDDQERLGAEVERWSKTADDVAKAALAKVIRDKRLELQFDLRRETHDAVAQRIRRLLAALDLMAGQAAPADSRKRHEWLFENDHVSWAKLDLDEADEKIGWRERDALVAERRREALAEIEDAHGADALYGFALGLDRPQIAAQVLVGRDVPVAEKVQWAAQAMRDADQGENAEAFLSQVLFIHDEEVLADVIGGLEELNLLDHEADRKRLGPNLPSTRAGRQLAERIGGSVRETYWSSTYVTIFHDEGADEAEFVARQFLEAGRPRAAYAAVHFEPKKLAAETWIEILERIVRGDDSEGPLPDRYHLEEILGHLDDAPDVSDAQIAALEWLFAMLLERHGGGGRSTWALHRLINANPREYVGLLRWLYHRDDDASEPDLEEIDSEQRRLRGKTAYRVFQSWSQLPGTQSDGSLDEEAFRSWGEETIRLSTEHGRLLPALSCLAACLARVAKRRGFDEWLPEAVLELLDRPELNDLREAFEIGVHNARGVTMRGPYDGGAQERALAKQYRELGERKSNSYPRVAAMLERIAESYDRDAAREDQQTQLAERWHP